MAVPLQLIHFIIASGDAPSADLTGRMMVLAIQLGIILFTARIFGVLAEKAGIPGVLGELVSGIIIGPFLLGGIPFYGFPQGLFPVYHAAGSGGVIWPELMGISSIAAVVLLFNVGLETDLKLLLKYSFSGGMVGLGGVLFSFFLGDYALVLFSRTLSGTPLGFMSPECLFAGTVATATSVGITARILSEKKKMDTAEGVTILSAAVIDDVIGIVVLAVVMGMVAAGRTGATDWSHIGIVSAKAVGVWLAGTVLGITASRRIGKLLKLS
ncbi:MAG TPA: cation:proton antiporter, partial [Candidatus Sabulitectum sp.]|nr:cation:proton antiporter [Candidatus Sabulitectum sp.]